MADVERFEKYGFFATLHTLSGGDPLKFDAMLEVPAITIFNTLMLNREKAEYSSDLHNIMNPRKR